MQLYLKNDYADAIPGLRAATKASPGTPSFHFYLGACYLLTEQPDPAIDSLRKTISLGNPGYSEPAHFYLAKAYLRKKDVSDAVQELQTTVQLNGSKAAEAQVLLHQLGK
jgi:tetratricopeptide (TPR) repeat protein